jgi:putative transcriptional regulator
VTFAELAEQLNLNVGTKNRAIRVHFGGPVETGRGFVLHSADYKQDTTMLIGDSVGLTATIDILKAMAEGKGPKNSLLALGYAGWGPGQLDGEIQSNGWLSVPADDGLIFGQDLDARWEAAMAKIGINAGMLSGDAGHA